MPFTDPRRADYSMSLFGSENPNPTVAHPRVKEAGHPQSRNRVGCPPVRSRRQAAKFYSDAYGTSYIER